MPGDLTPLESGTTRAKRVRVLVAEDDPAMRAVLEAVVTSDDALELLVTVGDAEAAIVAARAHRPDVCVLDVSMPRGGGPRAARGIRAACPTARLVAFSGREDRETVVEMLRAGVVGYVVKGATAEEILDAVHRTARGEPALSAAVTGGVVHELSAHLARRESEAQRLQAVEERVRAVLSSDLLSVAFQPICDLNSREAVGFEALARFNVEPRRGPDAWFADAGEVGLLLDLELMAARTAMRALPTISRNAFLAINVSPATVCAPELLEILGAPDRPGRVVVEITEHAPIDDYSSILDALDRLRDRGVSLAVDDAGAGFASLRHILRLDPDFIKIDGALTRRADTELSERALARALIAFAAETCSSIVAEGLETEAQIATLRDLGVQLGQGYGLGRPTSRPTARRPISVSPGSRAPGTQHPSSRGGRALATRGQRFRRPVDP